MEALRSFLDNHRVNRGGHSTHTTKSTGDIKDGWSNGCYFVDNKNIKEFTKIFNDAVWENTHLSRPTPITLTEKPSSFSPLRVDFDFKAPMEIGTKRQYTTDIIKKIVSIYQNEISAIVDDSAFSEEVLWCIVLEKESPRNEEMVVKDGFHLHFPYFVCDKWVADSHLRSRVTTRLVQEGVWKNMKLLTKPADIIDTEMAMKPWMMYGCCNYKGPTSRPYTVSFALDNNLSNVSLHDFFEQRMLGKKREVEYYLPEFLSVRGYTTYTTLKSEVERKKNLITTGAGRRRRPIMKKRSDEEVLEDIQKIKAGQIMEMLSDHRAEGYHDWMEVGWTLFSIGQGHIECLDMWIEFSKKSPKYTDGVCEREWNKMQVRDKTMGSLMRMAMIDSPREYQQYKTYNVEHLARDCLRFARPTECAVARIVWCKYGDRFVCADARNDIWYQYTDHRWELMEDGLKLKDLLLNEVSEVFFELQRKIANKIADMTYIMQHLDREEVAERAQKKQDIEWAKEEQKRAKNIGDALWTNGFQRQVVIACKIKMHQRLFLNKLDTNYKLVGFANGVLDLEHRHFRDGRPDDYISLSTKIEYHTYRDDDDEIREIKDYMMKVYPNPNIRDCAWNIFALCLEGNVQKSFVIPTGGSDGAKTMTFNLLSAAFGDYFTRVSREQFVQRTNSNNSSSARPDVLEFNGRRIVAGSELTEKDNINCSFIKEFTGQEDTKARGLFSGVFRTFKLNAVLFLGCNDKPQLDGRDEATFSRVIILDHQSKFVLPKQIDKFPVPESFEEQMAMKRFHADPSLRDRLEELAPAFMYLLFQRYAQVRHDIPPLPEEVKISTQLYQTENNVFMKYAMRRLRKCANPFTPEGRPKFIASSLLFADYSTWYGNNFSYMGKKEGQDKFLSELKNLLFEITKDTAREKGGYGFYDGKLYGYEFIKIDGDDDLEDEIVLEGTSSDPFK